jgi:type II secretory pathway component GspD/PulD (secretin)
MLLTPAGKKTLDDFLPLIDRKQEGVPVQLRYIQADSLLKNLPPSVAKEDIQQTGDSTLVFFSGTEEKRKQFLRELEVLDRPTPQIRYELLVVQYEAGESLNWGVSLDTSSLTGVEQNAFLGSIGKLLSLNFDIVSTFGYLFAIKLNADLGTNKANVLADTTLNGISGQEIKFQNTTTTRYREVEIDPNTGKPNFTGVTREVTSGLIISMNGWVSGDGIITMKVSSTVSKQGADTSATTGNPPPTSEKVVATNVRTISGKPVVIGGLMQQEKTYIVNKVPFLGDIPLLGLLFQSKSDTLTNTELVIYIVPHVEFPEMRLLDAPRHLESLYERYVRAR